MVRRRRQPPRPRPSARALLRGVDHPLYGGSNCASNLRYGAAQWKAGPVPAAQRNAYVGELPVLVVRAMKHDACKGWSGGAWNTPPRAAGTARGSAPSSGAWRRRTRARRPPLHVVAALRRLSPLRRPPRGDHPRARRARPDGQELELPEPLRARPRLRQPPLRRLGAPRAAQRRHLHRRGSSRWLSAGQAISFLKRRGSARPAGSRSTRPTSSRRARSGPTATSSPRRCQPLHDQHGRERARLDGAKGTQAATCNPRAPAWARRRRRGPARPTPTRCCGSPARHLVQQGNRCGRGPTTNIWWTAGALGLAQRAAFARAPWPLPAM